MPPRSRNLLRIALITAAVVVAALLSILLAAPALVDTPAVQAEIHRKLSGALNGQIAWNSLHIQLLPSPRGVLRGVRLEIPGQAKVAMEQAEIYLRLIPLAHGHADISSVSVIRPVIELDLAASTNQPGGATDSFAAYRGVMGPVAQGIRGFAPDSVVSIEAGGVVVRASDLPSIELKDLSLRAQTGAQGIDVEVTTASNLWRELHLAGRMEFADLSSRATLEVSDIRPQPWLERFLPDLAPGIALQTADLRVHAGTDAQTQLQCDVDLASPALRVTHNQRSLQVSGLRIKGTILARTQATRVDVTDLKLGNLIPAASGTLKVAGDAEHPEISFDVPRLDLASLRDAALTLARDVAGVSEYAPRIRGGEIAQVSVTAVADTWAELLKPQRIKAGLTLVHGAVLLPVVEQEATDLSVRAELTNGVIRLDSIEAKVGASKLAAGSATYSLLDQSLRVDSGFEIRLAQGLDIARKLLPPGQRDQFALIESASGRLPGRVRLSAPAHGDWNAEVEIAQSDAALRAKQLPWPIVLHASRVSVSPRQIALSGLRASLGQSSLEDAAVQIALDSESSLTSATAQATLALGELYPWLRAQPQLADALRDFTSVAGTAQVTLNRLTGQLNHAAELQYDLTLQPKQVNIVHEQLPARVNMAGGSFKVDPTTVKLAGVAVSMLDAQATISGIVNNYRSDRFQVDASIADGDVGPKAMQWTWEQAGAPPRWQPATPLHVNVSRARWGPDRNLEVQGAVQFDSGQSVTADVAWNPHELNVRRVVIKDRLSDATVGLIARNRLLRTNFSGRIDGASATTMFKERDEQRGVLEGDIRLTLDLDEPKRTTAYGRLTGRSIDLSRLLAQPVRVDRIALEADEQSLRIREATVDWAQQTATISGEVKRSERGAIVNAQIQSPGIVIDALLPKEPTGTETASPASATQPSPPTTKADGIFPHLWPLLVTGQISVQTPFLHYRDYRVAPVSATVTLEEQRAQMDLREAQLCGIAFPLTAAVTPQTFTVSAQLLARKQQLGDVARCLTDQRVLMTGSFDLRADVSTHGRRGDLVRNLAGTVELQTRDGVVNKFNLIGNILALKPVTDLFEDRKWKLESEGLQYRSLGITGRIDAGKFRIEEGAFDSAAVGLAATGVVDLLTRDTALTVLVAPFNQLNRLMRDVPVLGYILGGTFVSVPVAVRGDIRDPTVVPLGPQAITGDLTGIFERTLKLPGKLLAPFDPSLRVKQPDTQP